MNYKWMGAALVMVGCGGFGFSLAAARRKEEHLLRQLLAALQFMGWELQYRLTPLPELCRMAGRECRGTLGQVFRALARELDRQSAPEVSDCMAAALDQSRELPKSIRHLLRQLGRTLGRFDLSGQLQGLEAVKSGCQRALRELEQGRAQRLRSYQTLGLCAGAALAILLA